MIYNIYTIYDSVAEEAGPLFNAKNDSVAERQFKNMVQSQNISDWTEYHLNRVGTFDTEKMLLTSENKPVLIDISINLKIKEED